MVQIYFDFSFEMLLQIDDFQLTEYDLFLSQKKDKLSEGVVANLRLYGDK